MNAMQQADRDAQAAEERVVTHGPAASATVHPSVATAPTRRRKLHLGHFAFMRSVVQGLDTRDSWDRYLRIEGEHSDLRAVRTTIAWIRDEFAAAARREHRHGLARLVQIDLTSLGGPAPALPSLEDFAAEQGLAEFSQAEQLKAYEDAHGTPDAQARRRARLIAKQLESLRWLEELVAQPPLAGDAVASWLNPTLADRLEKVGIMTLAQLIERINGVGYRWSGSIKAIGRAKAERILDWLAFHAGSIGMTVGCHVDRPRNALARGELDAVVAPAAAIRPLEKYRPAAALDGRDGAFRRPQADCLMAADNDYAAVLAWLRAKNGLTPAQVAAKHARRRGAKDARTAEARTALAGSGEGGAPAGRVEGSENLDWLKDLSHTQRAYRSQAERLILWATLERGKPLSSLTHEDCEAYRRFLADPQPRTTWCGPRARERWSPLWRPFEGPLSAAAQRQAITILTNLYTFLVDRNYLIGNPWRGVSMLHAAAPRIDAGRSFTSAQWLFIERRLAALPKSPMTDRLKVALHLLYATGLRLSEVVAAKAGDLTWVSFPPDEADEETVDGWLLTVLGKGNKLREVPVPYEVTSELSAYFESRGLDSDLEEGDNRDACLLGKVPDDLEAENVSRRPRRADLVIDPRDGIAASTLYDQIKAFFGECATILAKQNEARGAERFAQASTHWMRHTHASHSIANGTPIQVAQQNLGHASLATTTIYVTTEKKERLKKMGAFWAQAAERRMGTVAVAPGSGESVDARGDKT